MFQSLQKLLAALCVLALPATASAWTFSDTNGCSIGVMAKTPAGDDRRITFRASNGSDSERHLDLWMGIGGLAGIGPFDEYTAQSVSWDVDGNPALRFSSSFPDVEVSDGGFRGLRLESDAVDIFFQWLEAGATFSARAQIEYQQPAVPIGQDRTLANVMAARDRGDFETQRSAITLSGDLNGSSNAIAAFKDCTGLTTAPVCGDEPVLTGLITKPNWNRTSIALQDDLRSFVADYGDACVESERLMSQMNNLVSRCVREPGFSRDVCEFLDVMSRHCRSDYERLRAYGNAHIQWQACRG